MRALQVIARRLKHGGIVLQLQTAQKHHTQGLMSEVYSVDSNKGPLMLHLISPIPEWRRQRVWEKIQGLSELLARHSSIPTARVLYTGKIGTHYCLVQTMLPGVSAGRRLVHRSHASNRWDAKLPGGTFPKVLEMTARIHAITLQGFGWVTATEIVRGRYESWPEFFQKELPIWLKSIERADARASSSAKATASRTAASAYVKSFLTWVPQVNPQLIHGDILNPGNVLVDKQELSGAIDWEWALSGDPAWEFAEPISVSLRNRRRLAPYFAACGIRSAHEQEAFVERAKAYALIWLLWGCHAHAHNPRGKLYRILRTLLTESLRKAPRLASTSHT